MEGWLSCTAAVPGKGRRGTQLGPLLGSPSSWRQTEFKQGQLFLQPALFSSCLPSPLSPFPPSFLFALEVSFSPFPSSSHRLIFQFCFRESCKQGPTALSLSRLLVFAGEKKSSTLSFFPRSWREQNLRKKVFAVAGGGEGCNLTFNTSPPLSLL